jgi:tellurite resistance protein TerC
MEIPLWCWLAAGALLLLLLSVDFAVHRGDRESTLRKALIVSSAWVGVSVAFGVVLGVIGNWESAGEYFGVYLTEKSLSIDNIFVFAILLSAFAVPAAYQRRVLFYGVFGALAFRGLLIAVGASLVDQFDLVLYLLGGLLILSGLRMARGGELVDPDRNIAIRLLRRVVPVTPDYMGQSFVRRVNGVLMATPLLVALLAIEITDLVFAMDSIPAAFGITNDVFVIFTANAFAVLGLRALYFVLVGAMDRFTYVKFGLAALLVFIGCKMLLEPFISLPILGSLAVIIAVIGTSIAASLWHERRAEPAPIEPRESRESSGVA